MDYTGTGNTLNVRDPAGAQDDHGFAALLGARRCMWTGSASIWPPPSPASSTTSSRLSSFFDTIHQDPTLAEVKLIAEPWDVGEGGYQVGNFPVMWAEWNGKYRDTVRRFWKGDEGMLSDFAYRLTGSSDLYQYDGRKPYASINFITAHDGFTLCDLVSYNHKHNEANGEDNRDGTDNNDSWNMGAEGPTGDPAISALRERQMRNFLATLMLSQGVPMLNGGDEFAHTQHGNNNGYCQDNEISWFNWNLDASQKRLRDFTCRLIEIRLAHPNLHRRKFFQDRVIRRKGEGSVVGVIRDIAWINPDGNEVSDEAWTAPWSRAIGLLLNGQTLQVTDEDGNWVVDDSFLLLVNAAGSGVEFTLPESPSRNSWCQVLDTENEDDPFAEVRNGDKVIVGPRTLKLMSDQSVSRSA